MKLYQSIFIIILSGSIVYMGSLGNGFVWDDEEQIVRNTVIQSLANIPATLTGATFTTGGAGLSGWFFRPLLSLTFMLNYGLWGMNPSGFHLFGIAVHLTNAVLLFFLLERLGSRRSVSTLLAAIFAVHPAISEAVVYVSAVGEVMYTFAALLALLTPHLALACFLLLTALLWKESAIAMFPVIAVNTVLYRRRVFLPVAAGLAATIVLYGILRLGLARAPIRHPQYAPISETTLSQRLLTIPKSITTYLSLIIFPKDLAISRHFVVKTASFGDFYLPLIVVGIIAGWAIFLTIQTKSRLMLLGAVWFVSGYFVISNIFPLDMTIAERWLYFPLIGIMVFLAGLLTALPQHTMRYILILFVIIIPVLAIRTMMRNADWKDGLTLYRHDRAVSINSFDLENNLGVELFRIGRYNEAKTHFERSLALQPTWYFAANNLGAVYQRQGDTKRAKELYLQALSASDYYLAYENAASLMLREGNLEEARAFTEYALKKLPGNQTLRLILSQTYAKLTL